MQTGRRTFIKHALTSSVARSGLAGILYSRQAPAAIASDSLRPMTPWGLTTARPARWTSRRAF
jgi:hypothetical protein